MEQITLIGNLASDVEIRFTRGGKAVGNVNVAVNDGSADNPHASFHRLTVWGEMAEQLQQSCPKGTRVVVVGRYRQHDWQTEGGEKRSRMEITVDEIGPSLRWATATVSKVTKGGDRAPAMAGAGGPTTYDDFGEEPF